MTEQELAELDLAVARAEGIEACIAGRDGCVIWLEGAEDWWKRYWPTRDGAEAMRLLEKYGLWVTRGDAGTWESGNGDGPFNSTMHRVGLTPMEAICRAVVALKEKS